MSVGSKHRQSNSSRAATLSFLTVSMLVLSGGGHSALRFHEARPLPPQTFNMEPYDDVVELQSEELSNYLNFSGSQMKPIVKVSVACYLDTKRDHCPAAVPYQDLWFRNGDPIGAKQLRSMPVPERDQIAMLIKPRLKPLSEGEIAACAGAMVRLRLLFALRHNLLVVVRVPGQSMDGFIDALRKQNFVPYREARPKMNSLIAIQLESEMGRREATCFIPPGAN